MSGTKLSEEERIKIVRQRYARESSQLKNVPTSLRDTLNIIHYEIDSTPIRVHASFVKEENPPTLYTIVFDRYIGENKTQELGVARFHCAGGSVLSAQVDYNHQQNHNAKKTEARIRVDKLERTNHPISNIEKIVDYARQQIEGTNGNEKALFIIEERGIKKLFGRNKRPTKRAFVELRMDMANSRYEAVALEIAVNNGMEPQKIEKVSYFRPRIMQPATTQLQLQ